ncbi:MAG: alpha-ketoacid dehydrogenase subunit beta [Firmicutes bacterium]|nr:alpha-ketoacid dehydrogenase subunit beta [Bacillota bacterium]
MANMTLIQAVNSTLHYEMNRDNSIVVLGEDVGREGGVFRATDGLQKTFGEQRVFDTPLSESGIVGTAVGMALYGIRPVVEIQFLDFIYPAFDQIVSEMAKFRYRSGGKYTVPMVIRAPFGGGIKGGHYHSQSPEAYFCHTAGLYVVVPSTPADAKGLLLSSIRDNNPVIFLEPKKIYRAVKGEVPEGEYTVPLGKARVVKEGTDLTILTYGAMVYTAKETEKHARDHGYNIEIIDLRTLVPLDIETILQSVRKTSRVVIVHEGPRTSGFGAELSALIAEKAIDSLAAPIKRVTGYDTPFPYSLENWYMPDECKVFKAIDEVMNW